MNTQVISKTNFSFSKQQSYYQGKVRDVYTLQDKLVVIATDRISAFDVILPEAIPFKGQVLNQLSFFWLENTKDIVSNWAESQPHPNVTIGKKCEALPIEMVIRGYLAGSAWRAYRDGKREMNGKVLPDGLKENDPLPYPIITPSTKAEQGEHDEDISEKEIIEKGILTEKLYHQLEDYTFKLFERGQKIAKEKGLILVDTKYEFGLHNYDVYLIDEIHTPDSSRYFDIEGFEERQYKGEAQPQRSKEMVRKWLMANGFQGREGEKLPTMDVEWIEKVSQEYTSLYEQLTGKSFEPVVSENILENIEKSILDTLSI